MKKEINLQQVCIDAEMHARNQKLDSNSETTLQASQPTGQINHVADNGNPNNGKGKKGWKRQKR